MMTMMLNMGLKCSDMVDKGNVNVLSIGDNDAYHVDHVDGR